MHNYGRTWALKKHKNELILPTPNEILNGLYVWLAMQFDDHFKKLPEGIAQNALRNDYKKFKGFFDQMKELLQIKDIADKHLNINKQMKKQSQEAENEHDLDLSNPYSKMSCLILYLYSMELGSPPLYFVINQVIRDQDLHFQDSLGPYIRALETVTAYSERNRSENDKIKTGNQMTS